VLLNGTAEFGGVTIEPGLLKRVDSVPNKPFQLLNLFLSLCYRRIIASPLPKQRPGATVPVEQLKYVFLAVSGFMSSLTFESFDLHQHS
jgi:hypothetical protein